MKKGAQTTTSTKQASGQSGKTGSAAAKQAKTKLTPTKVATNLNSAKVKKQLMALVTKHGQASVTPSLISQL